MNINTLSTLIVLLTFFSFNISAQGEFREFNTNDSTEHVLNSDTTIIVSRTKLYYHTSVETTLFYDFSIVDTTMFIKDFDIISDNTWYVIFGKKLALGPTTLYKTIDKGITWVADTSINSAVQEAANIGLIADESLSQLQCISEDTLMLFVSYYQSGIFYSVDSGQSWDLWFANIFVFYKGLFKCGSDYFLWGQEGDALHSSMFSFSSDLLLSPDTNNVWSNLEESYHPDCHNGGNPDCIYAPNSISGYDQFLFFENYINENCSGLSVRIQPDLALDNLLIFPNPSHQGKFRIQQNNGLSSSVNYRIYAANGQLLCSNKIQNNNYVDIDLSLYNQGYGVYFLVANYLDKVITKKIVY